MNGRNLARVLGRCGIPFIVIELNPQVVRTERERGRPIIYGDASRPEVLEHAGIRTARVVVIAISDAAGTRGTVDVARRLNPHVHLIVRSRYVHEMDPLFTLGTDEVIPEEFETSIEIFSRVLESYHIPKNVVDAEVKVLRAERYGVLRACEPIRPSMEKIADLLTAGTAETFYIGQDSWPSGSRSDRFAGPDRSHGHRRRPGGRFVHRSGRRFRARVPGDTLVLVASHAAMDRAFAYLDTGEALQP